MWWLPLLERPPPVSPPEFDGTLAIFSGKPSRHGEKGTVQHHAIIACEIDQPGLRHVDTAVTNQATGAPADC